jgi:hypothetical protein
MYYNITEEIRQTDGGINLDKPGEHAGDKSGGKLRIPHLFRQSKLGFWAEAALDRPMHVIHKIARMAK